MEHSNHSRFVRVESTVCGSSSGPLSAGKSAILGVSDNSKIPVELFLEENGGGIHPIFNTENQSCQRSRVLTQKAFSQSTFSLHTNQFLEAMKAYQESSDDPSISEFDLRGKHSWDDVLRVAKDAEAKYLKAGEKALRKAGRSITNKSEAVMPYLQLIPNGFYTSILCGGLKLIFEAAALHSETRGKVLKTLLRIPNIITQAEHCVETFPSDAALHDRAAELYLAILTAIEGITNWLMQKSPWKQVRVLALGPLYTKSLNEKIQALEEAMAFLQTRVCTLRDRVLIRTEKVVESVETVIKSMGKTGEIVDSTTKATLHHVHSLESEMKDLNLAADRTDSKVSSITEDIKTLTKSQDTANLKIDHLRDLEQVKAEAREAMKIVLKETARMAQWMAKRDRAIYRLKRQIEMLKATNSFSQDDLVDLLGVSIDSSTQDLRRMLRAGQSMELSASQIAQGIIESRKFKEWLASDASATLFIERGAPSASHGRNSPMSLMSSIVIDSLEGMKPAVPIHFFCGSHTSSRDSMKGPHGMMRSLICQILQAFSVNLDFISSREQLRNHKFDALCDCFKKLVKQLPMDTVLFCIVDSICFFEKEEWAKDCQKAVNELQDVANDDTAGAVFKLLITSPLRSRYVGATLPSQCRLSLLAEDWNGRDGPTEREIRMRARRPMNAKQSDIIRSLPAENRRESGGEESPDSVSESENPSSSGIE